MKLQESSRPTLFLQDSISDAVLDNLGLLKSSCSIRPPNEAVYNISAPLWPNGSLRASSQVHVTGGRQILMIIFPGRDRVKFRDSDAVRVPTWVLSLRCCICQGLAKRESQRSIRLQLHCSSLDRRGKIRKRAGNPSWKRSMNGPLQLIHRASCLRTSRAW